MSLYLSSRLQIEDSELMEEIAREHGFTKPDPHCDEMVRKLGNFNVFLTITNGSLLLRGSHNAERELPIPAEKLLETLREKYVIRYVSKQARINRWKVQSIDRGEELEIVVEV